MGRTGFHLLAGISHCNRHAGLAEHREIIIPIADDRDGGRGNGQSLRERFQEGSLIASGRRDVEIVGLRTGNEGLVTQRFAHRAFAFCQPREVPARPHDLESVLEMSAEIRHDEGVGANCPSLIRNVVAGRVTDQPAAGGIEPDINSERR
jgi:hypothetical protein